MHTSKANSHTTENTQEVCGAHLTQHSNRVCQWLEGQRAVGGVACLIPPVRTVVFKREIMASMSTTDRSSSMTALYRIFLSQLCSEPSALPMSPV